MTPRVKLYIDTVTKNTDHYCLNFILAYTIVTTNQYVDTILDIIS